MDHYVLCDMYTLGLIVHTLYINNTVHVNIRDIHCWHERA